MKKILLLLILLTSAGSSFSQDYMDSVGRKACQCINNIPPNTAKENLTTQFGVCIINSFNAAEKDQFQKEFNLGFRDLVKDGEKIGSIVGGNMTTQCPDTLLKVSSAIKSNSNTVKGVISKIENDAFVVFSLRDQDGVTSKFIWLNQFPSNYDLPNTYKTLMGKSVEFKYEVKLIFDPKIGEYRQYKVLTSIF